MMVHSCDQCGTHAPAGHSHLFPERGWYVVKVKGGENSDFCSVECLAATVRMWSGVTTDESVIIDQLEELYEMPDYVPAPRPARKPRAKRTT